MIRRRPHTAAAVSSSLSSSPTLVIKRTRTRLGLFTLEPVAKGARLIEYTGELISSEESNARGGKYLFQLDEQRVIDGKARITSRATSITRAVPTPKATPKGGASGFTPNERLLPASR